MAYTAASHPSGDTWRRNHLTAAEKFTSTVEFEVSCFPQSANGSESGAPAPVRLEQALLDPTQDGWMDIGCGSSPTVFDASMVLADFLCAGGAGELRGRSVIDIGAGCGLLGLVAARLGASSVTLTEVPMNIPLLRQNVAINFPQAPPGEPCHAADADPQESPPPGGAPAGEVHAEALVWGEHAAEVWWGQRAPWDVIVGSDIGVAPQDQRTLAQTLAAAAGPSTTMWLCHEQRWADTDRWFEDELRNWFSVERLPVDAQGQRYRGFDFNVIKCQLLPDSDDED